MLSYSAAQTFKPIPLPLHKIEQIPQYRPLPPREVDVPSDIYRQTEEIALYNIATRRAVNGRTHGHMTLSQTHLDLLRLERAAMQFLPPYYGEAEIVQFVADAYKQKFHALITAGQVKAFLEQAGHIMLAQEMAGLPSAAIRDYSAAEFEVIHHPAKMTRKQRRRLAA